MLPARRRRDRRGDARSSGPWRERHAVDLFPLHGSLDGREQDAALAHDAAAQPASPKREARRRVILATNIAETSLTVPGVSMVVDTGLQKVARYDADRARRFTHHRTDHARQRRSTRRPRRAAWAGPRDAALGRARQAPPASRGRDPSHRSLAGRCFRFSAGARRPTRSTGSIARHRDRIAPALELLTRLGAVEDGRVTALGRQMQRLPLPPRLARIVIEARGSFEGCAACAWLAEPTRLDAGESTSSDVLPVLDRWSSMPGHLKRVADALRPGRCQRCSGRLAARASTSSTCGGRCSPAIPDRVARDGDPGNKVTLATGHGAVLGRETRRPRRRVADRARR